MDTGFLYDVTREERRRALTAPLASGDPDRAARITEALARGQRILFAYDDGELYVETPMDRILHDDSSGRPIGARRV